MTKRVPWSWLISAVFALLPLVVLFLCHHLQNQEDDTGAVRLNTWFQFFTGNWPNWSGVIDRRGWAFAEAVAFRFALAYAPTYGAGAIFWRLVRWQKEQTMRFGDLLQDRDLTMEAQILNTLPLEQRELIRPQLRRAILKAAELWASKYLPIYLHGEKAAERTLQAQVPRE